MYDTAHRPRAGPGEGGREVVSRVQSRPRAPQAGPRRRGDGGAALLLPPTRGRDPRCLGCSSGRWSSARAGADPDRALALGAASARARLCPRSLPARSRHGACWRSWPELRAGSRTTPPAPGGAGWPRALWGSRAGWASGGRSGAHPRKLPLLLLYPLGKRRGADQRRPSAGSLPEGRSGQGWARREPGAPSRPPRAPSPPPARRAREGWAWEWSLSSRPGRRAAPELPVRPGRLAGPTGTGQTPDPAQPFQCRAADRGLRRPRDRSWDGRHRRRRLG